MFTIDNLVYSDLIELEIVDAMRFYLDSFSGVGSFFWQYKWGI